MMLGTKKNVLHSRVEHSIEYCSALIVTFSAVLFSLWTIGSHAATILNVSWAYLSIAAKYFSPVGVVLAFLIARRFAKTYCEGLSSNATASATPNSTSLIALTASAMAIFVSNNYIHKYCGIAIGIVAITFLSREAETDQPPKNTIINYEGSKNRDLLLLFFIMLPALAVVLFAHRPDLDDSSFIQIATQTLAHEDRAPLSFDASLGYVLETFRFAPYRISSYETLVAFASNVSGIDIYSVYYLILPSVTAILTILTAFVFSRWFFPTNILAIAATAIFMIITLAWGETHIAYGNRVFVRLFQGKGLIIALTTPFAIITGLVLANRPSYFAAGMLTVANIYAIGVSSSGLVMTLFTSMIVGFLAISRNFKKMARSWILIVGAMTYPVSLAFWLRFQNKSAVSMSDLGTYLPINASLGMDGRESIAIVGLLFGYSLFISSRNKSYILIIIAVFSFILNPWFSEIISFATSRNMSWRLAWAAPIPLLLSIALVAGFSIREKIKTHDFITQSMTAGSKIISIGLLLAFLFSYKWATSSDNGTSWGLPSSKLPREFYVTSQIADKIRTLDVNGQILAHQQIAAWLPLNLPGVKLVMPGHSYPIQLETVLPRQEFESRIALYNAINNDAPSIPEFAKGIRDLDVDLIIIPTVMESNFKDLFSYLADHSIQLEKLELFSDYALYKVHRGS